MTKETAPLVPSGFQIFDKSGKTSDRIAVNLTTGVVIETDGPGKFFLYVGGRQHLITSSRTLEDMAGLPAAKDEHRGE